VELVPAFQEISTEQLVGLLRAALRPSAAFVGTAIHTLARIPAFKQLTTSEVASIMTDTIAEAAASSKKETATSSPSAVEKDVKWHMPFGMSAASHAASQASVGTLCICILQAGSVAGRDNEAVMQWLLPAVTAALSTGMLNYACVMATLIGDDIGTDDVMVLLQAALHMDQSGTVFDSFLNVPAAQSLTAEQLMQLLRSCSECGTAGSTPPDALVKQAIMSSRGWSSISAPEQLPQLLPALLPWLSAEQCTERLQALSLTAEETAELAKASCGLWGETTSVGCGCLAKLQGGVPVRHCPYRWRERCAAVQLSSLLLPAACAEETQHEAVPQCPAASVPDSEVEQPGAFQTVDQAGSAAGSAAVHLSNVLLPAASVEEAQHEAVPQCPAASVSDTEVEQRGAFQTADQAGSAAGSAA
jgi:hypothetical protein